MTIHEQTAATFDSLGLGTLIPSRCTVTEELNGLYELEMEHPYDDNGKWKRIENGRILHAPTPTGKQPFRIYNVVPDMNGIKINAKHIFYDLIDNLCGDVTVNGTAAEVLAAMQSAFAYPMPFKFSTNITDTAQVKFGNMNPVAVLLGGGDEKTTTFADAFGGEVVRDGFYIRLNVSAGEDRGVTVRYGKNLIGLEVNENLGDVRTRILCVGKYGQEWSVDSPYIDRYLYPKIHVVSDENKPIAELQKQAQELLAAGIDLPKVNIKVEFAPLAKTVEYSRFAALEDVFLGDTVTVINEKMGFAKQAKVISYVWDCLLEQYEQVELGDFVPSIETAISSGMNSYTAAQGAGNTAADASALVREHLTDYGNPHRVTAEQIGGLSGFAKLNYVDEELSKIDTRLRALGG